MVEEETLGRGLKGGGKEELGRPRYNKTTQVPRIQERRRKWVFLSWNE